MRLKSLLRATSASLVLLLVGGPAIGQLRPGAADRAKELNQQKPQQPGDQNNAAANAAAKTVLVSPWTTTRSGFSRARTGVIFTRMLPV